MEFNMMQYRGEYPFNFNGFKVKPGMWFGTGWGNVPVATFGVRRGGKVLFFIGDGSHTGMRFGLMKMIEESLLIFLNGFLLSIKQ